MINKISARSECFDIFTSKMISQSRDISKRAGIIPLSAVEHGAEALKDLAKASRYFDTPIAAEAIESVGSRGVKEGLLILKDAITSESIGKLSSELAMVSKSPEAQRLILNNTTIRRLYGATTYQDFIDIWGREMLDMGQALNATDGAMTTAQSEAFYAKYGKQIQGFEALSGLSDSGALRDAAKAAPNVTKTVVQKTPAEVAAVEEKAAAEAAATTKKVAPQTVEEIAAAEKAGIKPGAKPPASPPSPTEVAAKAAERATARAGAMIVGKGALSLSLLAAGIYFGAQGIRSVFSSSETKHDLDKITNAIACIKDIGLASGSPAATERDIIIENIKAYTSPKSINSLNAARDSLSGGVGTSGSIKNFVYLITNDPETNLSGYLNSPKTDTAGAAIVGAGTAGAFGFGLGGPIGGIVGASFGGLLAGYLGYQFVTSRYSDQINCVVGAIDAMAVIDRRITDAGSMDPEEQTEAYTGRSKRSSAEVSALAKILVAMSENKLVGKRGPNLINEKNLINSLLERATNPSIAASALIQSNYNIATAVKSDSIQGIIGAIDRGAVRGNPELKYLMQDIIDTVPNAIRALQQGKIKESKILHTRLSNMKKLSTSTNQGTIKKKAEESKASYFGDANLGLQDSLTKSYYAGLTGMYNEKLPSRSSDYKDLYGFQEETGPDLVQQSHSKSVTLADAMGKGGLVENGLEQQEKSHYMATSTPSGNFQSKYAQTLKYLTKLAKAADEQGKKDVSELINQTIKTLK